MISSKIRSKLSAMAQQTKPIFQIGKNGVTDIVLKELDSVLEARELIKINVIRTSQLEAKQLINQLAEQLNAEPISAVGSKIVLYRKSNKQGIKHILE